MKKKQRNILIILIIILAIGAIAFSEELKFFAFSETFTPIYCNDYEFTCCVEKPLNPITVTLDKNGYAVCADFTTKCVINSATVLQGDGFYIGSQNCRLEDPWYGSPYYKCDDERLRQPGDTPFSIQPGDKIYPSLRTQFGNPDSLRITVTRYEKKLFFCGDAGCSVGVRIASDQCTFQVNENVYDEDGRLKGTGTRSYTVPKGECLLSWLSGKRHICGNREEICQSDADCDGHTYGDKECYGRTLQTYGCREFGNAPSQSDLITFPWESTPSGTFVYGKRCEIIKAQSVQCCGDADCGTNAFCDTTTFTCKEEVECRNDYDCGVSVLCDINTLQLKTPICSFGKCDYDVSPVDCCSDIHCVDGWFCDIDYKCKEGGQVRISCPFECCPAKGSDDKSKYFDKKCPSGDYCDEENKCITPDGGDGGRCNSCFSWLYSKIKPEHCEPRDLFELKVAGFTLMSAVNQSTVCPIFLILFGGILALLIWIGYLAYKKYK